MLKKQIHTSPMHLLSKPKRTAYLLSCCVRFSVFVVAVLLASSLSRVSAEEPTESGKETVDFEFRDQELVAFIGDGLIEQEQYFGWVELALTTAAPDKNLKFRNLGWSGDTPAGQSRFGLSLMQAGREPKDEGWKQLQAQITNLKPTMAILGYGMASALEDKRDGLESFRAEYQRLLDHLKATSPEIELVLLSPIPRLDDQQRQATLAKYSDAIRQLAEANQAVFVDFQPFPQESRFYKDPIHLNGLGYQQLANEMIEQLGLSEVDLSSTPQLEKLRQVILRKNQWWFHRSRPANMAYVFGFRKHEQGQNAVEIPKFDPLIEAEESRIAKLKRLDVAIEELADVEPRKESQYAKFTPQPTPEFTVDENWEVTLWAENPQLNKPIHMNFDPQGRLWVASSEAYPMIEVGQAAPDKIIVLEDTNQDGQADQSTVFADDLLIPTGVLPGNGGVYVAQSTDLLFLKDTDGDGKADIKERVLSGFGTEDTHHNLHTLKWGHDGRMYMNQSVYTRTDAETPVGVLRLKAGGGIRMNPNTLKSDILFRGLWNSWGHQFDRHGNSFLSDGAGFNGLAYAFPGAMFNPTPNAKRQLELISPGRWPKFCSLEIIEGDSFPPEWQGSIITCDFRANRVTRFGLNERAAGWFTEQEADLLRTSATSFRPIDVKQGPDGALYIADWSNPIINHGEVDFRDERRDRWHGRIWKLRWKGAPEKKPTDLTQLDTATLLDQLIGNDRYLREMSRRLLIERGEESLAAAKQWATAQQDELAKLETLWLSEAFNRCDETLLTGLLDSESAKIRTAAVRVLNHWSGIDADVDKPITASTALDYLAKLVVDSHPRVRLEAVRALSDLQHPQAELTATNVLTKELDPFIDYALWLTVTENTSDLLTQLGDETVLTSIPAKQLEFVLTSLDPKAATGLLNNYLSSQQLAANGEGPWLELIGKAGDQALITRMFDQLLTPEGFDEPTQLRVISVLQQTQRSRRIRPRAPQRLLEQLQSQPAASAPIQSAGVQLLATWKVPGTVKLAESLLSESTSDDRVKLSALAALRMMATPEASKVVREAASHIDSHGLRRGWISALASLDINGNAELILETIATASNDEQIRELWRAALQTQDAGKVLASKIPAAKVSPTMAQAGLRVASEGRRDETLVAALLPLSGESMTAANMTLEKRTEFSRLVIEKGNAERGEAIYFREKLACVTCHAIAGVGGAVGPDLSSIGASAPVDYLVESLFAPDAKIKEGFHSVVIITTDGQVLTGVETGSNEEQTTIRTATNELVSIPSDEIEEKSPGNSLMPTGVVDQLSQQDQLDLVSFLTRLGKQGDFDASSTSVARVVEVFAGTHRIEQQGIEPIVNGELKQGWKQLVARVNGGLPQASLLDLTRQPVNIALVHVYIRIQFEVETERDVTFTFRGAEPIDTWLDGEPIETSKAEDDSQFKTSKTFGAGAHTLLLRLDAKALPDSFFIESNEVTFSTEM